MSTIAELRALLAGALLPGWEGADQRRRILAAIPALLDVVEAAIAVHESSGCDSAGWCPVATSALAQLDDALRKVTP